VSVSLYMDVHVRSAVTMGLRRRGVDVITAQEDGAARLPDPGLLDRSTKLDRVLFSQDDDLLREARRREIAGAHFSGVIYVHQMRLTIGQIIQDLELISKASDPKDFQNRVEYLPL
jgi:Domain of unknown function (DUF5615)